MKRFLKGFFKGIVFVISILLLLAILLIKYPLLEDTLAFTLIPTIGIIVIEFQMIKKAKFPQAYYLLAFLFNLLFLPILMGVIELEKENSRVSSSNGGKKIV